MGHRLTIASVDLGLRRQCIHERLLEIVSQSVGDSGLGEG